MIHVTFYAKEENKKFSLDFISGFRFEGHAEYSDQGDDIICASVSVLVLNTMNSIHTFTSDRFTYDEDEEKGLVDFQLLPPISDSTMLLLRSLLLGVSSIQDQYGKEYLQIEFQNSEGGVGHV